jgi:hypothetical protein
MSSKQARKIAEQFVNQDNMPHTTLSDIEQLAVDLATKIDHLAVPAGPRLTDEEWCQVKDSLRLADALVALSLEEKSNFDQGDPQIDALTKIYEKINDQQRAAGQAANLSLNTVNVIEMADGTVLGIVSYPDTKEGNQAAEERFRTVCKENGLEDADEIEACIEDGNAEKNGWEAYIVHSVPPQAAPKRSGAKKRR